MDNRPFFEFNLLQFRESQVEEIKKFTKASFNLDTIISTASNLKYHRGLLHEITAEFENPSEEFVRVFAGRVYNGRLTKQVTEQFTELTRVALRDFIKDRVNERLKSAIDTDISLAEPLVEPDNSNATEKSSIETTDEELEAYRIVQAIGAEVADPRQVTLRDNKTYCAILWADNNRNPICRLHFLKTKLSVSIFTPEGEDKHDIKAVPDLYHLKQQIQASIRQYLT